MNPTSCSNESHIVSIYKEIRLIGFIIFMYEKIQIIISMYIVIDMAFSQTKIWLIASINSGLGIIVPINTEMGLIVFIPASSQSNHGTYSYRKIGLTCLMNPTLPIHTVMSLTWYPYILKLGSLVSSYSCMRKYRSYYPCTNKNMARRFHSFRTGNHRTHIYRNWSHRIHVCGYIHP